MLLSRFPFLFGQAAAGGGAVAVDYFQVALATDQSGLALGTGNRVNFDTVLFDTLGGWDGINFQFLPPIAGKWLLSTTLAFDTSGNGTPQSAFAELLKNNTVAASFLCQGAPTGLTAGQKNTYSTSDVILSANGTTDFFNVVSAVLAVIGTYTITGNGIGAYQSWFTGLYLGT